MGMGTEAKEQLFWGWFAANKNSFQVDDMPEESMVRPLNAALALYDDALAWEIFRTDDGLRQLVISADGNIDAFPAVERLCAAAPELDGWLITAFRPAIGLDFHVEYGGLSLDPKEIWIEPVMSPEALDIIFYLPDFEEEKRELFIGGCFILMDMALGEYDAVKKIRYVDHGPAIDNPEEAGLVPLLELPAVIAYYYEYRTGN